MDFDQVTTAVAGVPHMTQKQGRTVYDHILATKARDILELGFAHGTSTCYLAAAADEVGGSVTTIDQPAIRSRTPNVWQMLDSCGLAQRVTVVVDDGGYLWALMRMLEADPVPRFDFCYIDGAHLWEVDGFAFLLVDRLLRPGGFVLLDDMDWTLATSPSMMNEPWVRKLPEEQRTTAQVRKVFDVLVRHSGYDCHEADGWGWARKQQVGEEH